jgi:hypothetical protein
MTGFGEVIDQPSLQPKLPSIKKFVTGILGNRRAQAITKPTTAVKTDTTKADQVIEFMAAASVAADISRITGRRITTSEFLLKRSLPVKNLEPRKGKIRKVNTSTSFQK